MGVYIVAGIKRDPSDISDERFGDSCYYLGFIFTISSIATSLLDVPLLDQQGKMKEIAVRFGAAMVSTFLGFIVRAYVAGFKTDSEDVLRSLEDRLIATAENFRVQLELAAERFEALDSQIHAVSRNATTRVELAIENAGKAASEGYAEVLEQMAARAKEISEGASVNLSQASARATAALQSASVSLEKMMLRSDQAVVGFTEKLQERIEDAKFPQEVVEESLKEPLNEIKLHMSRYAKSIEKLEEAIEKGGMGLSTAMGGLERSLVPDGKLGDALTQHYDALGNLIGLAEGTQRLMAEQSAAIKEGVQQVTAALTSAGQKLEASQSGSLDKISSHLLEWSRQQIELLEQQKKAAATIAEISARSKLVHDAVTSLATEVRNTQKEPPPEKSGFSRFFGGPN